MANEDPARVDEITTSGARENERSISHDDQGHTGRAKQTLSQESGAAGADC